MAEFSFLVMNLSAYLLFSACVTAVTQPAFDVAAHFADLERLEASQACFSEHICPGAGVFAN